MSARLPRHQIAKLVEPGLVLVTSQHAALYVLFLPNAVRQMSRPERMISTAEVREVLMNGEVIEEYPDDPRGPSALLLGCGATRIGGLIRGHSGALGKPSLLSAERLCGYVSCHATAGPRRLHRGPVTVINIPFPESLTNGRVSGRRDRRMRGNYVRR